MILKKHFEEYGADQILGVTLLTSGVLVLLHSPKFNRDYPLLVAGTDVDHVSEYVHSTKERLHGNLF